MVDVLVHQGLCNVQHDHLTMAHHQEGFPHGCTHSKEPQTQQDKVPVAPTFPGPWLCLITPEVTGHWPSAREQDGWRADHRLKSNPEDPHPRLAGGGSSQKLGQGLGHADPSLRCEMLDPRWCTPARLRHLALCPAAEGMPGVARGSRGSELASASARVECASSEDEVSEVPSCPRPGAHLPVTPLCCSSAHHVHHPLHGPALASYTRLRGN